MSNNSHHDTQAHVTEDVPMPPAGETNVRDADTSSGGVLNDTNTCTPNNPDDVKSTATEGSSNTTEKQEDTLPEDTPAGAAETTGHALAPISDAGKDANAAPVEEKRGVQEKDNTAATEAAEAAAAEDDNGSNSDDAQGASNKRPRSPSPVDDSDFMSQPPPRPTIRLEVVVNPEGTSKRDYIVNIPRMAVNRLKGQHPRWAQWYSSMYLNTSTETSVPDTSLSQQELHDLGGLAKLLQKYPSGGTVSHKKRRHDEHDVGSYDTKDPFVDDSELVYDEPAYCVKMLTNGFYVAAGPVEFETKEARSSSASSSAFRSSLANSKGVSRRMAGYAGITNKLLAKRAASRKGKPAAEPEKKNEPQQQAAPAPAPAVATASATPAESKPADLPAASTTAEEPAPVKTAAPAIAPKPAEESGESKPKKNKYPTRPVHPQLQQMFDNLKVLVQRASFAVKTKFPPELKPPLIETAKLAVELDEYNDNFFNILPSIFPYNRFTMMKLTKREFFHKHMEYYRDLQEEHLDTLYGQMHASLPEQISEYNAAMEEWRSKGNVSKPKEEDKNTANDDSIAAETEADVTQDAAPGDEPVKRFRWSEAMREELFTVVTVENAMSEIRNEKLKLENSPETYSEINARKSLYKRIADFIPEEGWINTTNVSREYGLLKKRRDRQDMDDDFI
ncbi:hypothetical protein MCUN1_000641 [Malassezia cuniculi]|uniref:Ubinuclein middle domain-containing protein n=1 Tax=Malassezia cuniculi TaxID=948313 RepID=A0AAF0ESZ0_9BASI|nr:hypothetical protein MCUN1_000641 [Malassezia cuniculi]